MIQNTYLAILGDLFGVVPDLFPMGTLPRAGYYRCLNQGIERIEALPDFLPWLGLISQVFPGSAIFTSLRDHHVGTSLAFPFPLDPWGWAFLPTFLVDFYLVGG